MTAVLLATPLFALFDLGFGDNIRAPALSTLGVGVGWRVAYYVGVTAIGLLALWLPSMAAPLSALEAGANVLIAILAVVLPYSEMLESAEAGREIVPPDLPLVSLLIAAVVATLSAMSLRSRGLAGRAMP